jgi:PQQ-dependent catabolism-associated CXXCW motif protein
MRHGFGAGRAGTRILTLAAAMLAGWLATTAAAASEISDPAKIPGLTDTTREAYLRFLKSEPSRAFAIGPNGVFGMSAAQPDKFTAMAAAMWQCNRAARNRCKIHAANDELMLPDYAAYLRDSARATQYVRAADIRGAFDDEDRDFGTPPQSELRRGDYQQPTPASIPGAGTITTGDLVKALQSPAPPVLIDVLPRRFGHETLPDAVWLRSAGNYFEHKDAEATALLGDILAKITPSKQTMIVFFCESTQCWLSYNASLRAASLGYTNVQWYRGGIAAWRAAKLPTVVAVLEAQF